MAEAIYDPQKAHEAYLKRRVLTPRQPGAKPDPTGHPRSSKPVPPPKTAKQLREEAEVRVLKLKEKLKSLRALLAQLVKQAKEHSGMKTEPAKTATSGSKDSGTKDAKNPSVQDKAAAAKRSKEYYDKNKKEEDPSKQEQSAKDDIAKVQAKIQKIRDELKASIATARTQGTPPT